MGEQSSEQWSDASMSPGRKRSWRWRLGQVVFAVFLLTLVGHVLWGVKAKSRFEGRLAELKSAGEPVEPSDFASPVVADDQNAAADLLAAGKLLDLKDPAWSEFRDMEIALPLDEKEIAAIDRMLQSKRQALALIESASAKPQVNWGIDPNTPYVFLDIPGLASMRACAQLVGWRAMLAHQQGREHEALHDLRQLLFLSRTIDQQATLVSHLVAIGISAMAADVAAQIAPDLRVGAGGVSAAEVRSIVDDLLNDRPLHDGAVAAMRRERLLISQVIVQIANGEMDTQTISGPKPNRGNSLYMFAAKPILFDDGRFAIDYYSGVVSALLKTNSFADFRAVAPPLPEAELEAHRWRHLVSAMMMTSGTTFVRTHYRVLADRRLAAIALAVRCYAVEHNGTRPATLEELAGAYLSAVPADPFAAGASLHYRGDGSDPVVYSVSDDGQDDHGSEQVAVKLRIKGRLPGRWECKDAVLHLTRQPRVKATDDASETPGN